MEFGTNSRLKFITFLLDLINSLGGDVESLSPYLEQ